MTLHIDRRGRRVFVDDVEVTLTRREFDLLAFLADNPGHVFSRDELLRAVWQSSSEWQSPATVTEHVGRIRRKLGDHHITALRGVGYRFDSTREAQSDVIDLRHADDMSCE